MKNENLCELCNIAMIWKGKYCVHCDWHLEEGYSPEEIEEIIKQSKMSIKYPLINKVNKKEER